ncbi:PHA/PHB synthase family protein [Pseudonocardia xishanensis]|uniref:Class II poly(R)-hydroxyalkanoic acid synthase n=1 Tax=Pseudonocardia xishanensis TaxID=630995 RepID=A0ABP8S1R2_9PSEU
MTTVVPGRAGEKPSAARPAAGSEQVTADETDALGVVEGGEAVGIPSAVGLLKGAATAFAQPGPVTRGAGRLVRDLASIVRGTDEHTPHPKDKRFADPAWSQNPVFRRLSQSYLALGSELGRLVDEYEKSSADWHDVERARFAVTALTSALSPTNQLPTNPAALKRAFDTAGGSLVRGARQFAHDVRHNGGLPSQTDRTAYTVGEDLALSPGHVIHRDEVAEIIEYRPSTPAVRERPLLVIPPPIGRFYFLDLRPGRSFVEYAVSRGLRVYMLSWRNPTAAQAEWDMDTYAGRILSGCRVVKDVAGVEDVNTLGFCAGGILQSTVLGHLAAKGDHLIHSASYGVTLLDFGVRAPIGAFSARQALEMARASSKREGVITARSLSTMFSWMRPDDLVFNYVVNNWLMGERPPVFDILAWNADGTNLPAALHSQFLDIFRSNTLAEGRVEVLGTSIDLGKITAPVFVVGALNDHLTPWTGCYRTTELVSGPSTYVLSNAGHIASLVNPPGNPKASYFIGGDPANGPEHWRDTAERRTGTWWEPWADWIVERSGAERPAPTAPGDADHPPLEPAPGSYVLDRVPPSA